MSDSTRIDVNSWLEEELYQQYQHNHSFVDPAWQSEFAAEAPANGTVAAAPVAEPPVAPPVVPVAPPQTQQMTKPETAVQSTPSESKNVD